jgi:TPR repeat protein
MDDTKLLEIWTIGYNFCQNGDYASCIKFYKKAARYNYSPALLELGNLHSLTFPNTENFYDEKKAKYYYKRAHMQGDPDGANNLSVYYRLKGKMGLSERWKRKCISLKRKLRATK